MTFFEAGIELIDCIHKTPAAVENGFPYIGIPQMKTGRVRYNDARKISQDDFLKWTEKVCPSPNDVIVSRRTNPGVSAIFKPGEEFALGQNLVLLRSDGNKVLPEFVRWMVHGPYWWAQVNKFINVGAVFDSLRCGDFKDFELPIPPKSEQIKISVLLAALDDRIELNHQINTTLEAMAQAIFKDWFVDFGPTQRKADAETDPVKILGDLIPDPTKAASIAALFPDSLNDDGLPQGWKEKPLDKIANFLNGAALQKYPPLKGDDSLPVIKIAQLRNGITEKANRASLNIPPKYLVENGDFLFSWSGSLLAKFWTDGRGALNQHLFKVTSDQYPKWFFSQWVYFHMREFQMIAESKATTMGHIKRQHLTEAKTNCPPDDVIAKLSEFLDPLIALSMENDLENKTLAETRDYLLPKLMSGEVRVGAAAPAVTAETSNVVGLNKDLFGRKQLPADQAAERDAVMVAAIIDLFDSDGFVVGNFRYQKGVYLLKRYLDLPQVTTTKQAAGPYDAALRYEGGHKIAKDRRYIREAFINGKTGNKRGSKISEAKAQIDKFGLAEGLNWVVTNKLRFKSNDELECLATVDFAMNELRARGSTISADAIIQDINRDDVWRPKLSKAHFRRDKIRDAITELNKLFGTV